jgi:hypothetical protein
MLGRAIFPSALLLSMLTACQASAPVGVDGPEFNLSVKAQVLDAGRSLQTLLTPVVIDHVDISVTQGATPIGSKTVLLANIATPIMFTHLHQGRSYTVQAKAYDVNASQISIDAQSVATISTVGLDDAQTVSLPVKLIPGPLFDGTVSDGTATTGALVINPGTLTNPATAAGFLVAGTQTSLLAGTGVASFSADATAGSLTNLSTPEGIAYADTPSPYAGSVFLADSQNHRIEQFDSADVMHIFAGSPLASSGMADGLGTAASFHTPSDLVFTPGYNTLYVADAGNSTIRQIALATGNTTTVAGVAGVSGTLDGTGGIAKFTKPSHLALDSAAQYLYVADFDAGTNYGTIRRIDTKAGFATTTLVTNTVAGFADGAADTGFAQMNQPQGLLVVGNHLYIADSNNGAIRDLDLTTHIMSTLAGALPFMGGPTRGFADGVGNSAKFNTPWGLSMIGNNLIVADAANNNLRQVSLTSNLVNIIAGNGSAAYSEGPLISAGIPGPHGLAFGGNTLYFTTSDNRLRRVL